LRPADPTNPVFQFLRRLPGRTLRGFLALALVAIVALVALTRTQVGRDALARRIESEFAETYDGALTIGRLTGNLMREFVASDITVVDGEGEESLHIDSLLVRTSWEDLVRRRVVVPRIVLVRPSVRIQVGDSGRFGVPGFARRVPAADSAGGFLRFRSARIQAADGRLVTEPADSARVRPEESFFADPADLRIEGIALDALLDWSATQRQFDLFRLSARGVTPQIELRSAEAQVVLQDDRISINRLRVALDRSRLAAEGMILLRENEVIELELSADAPEVSFDELRSAVPGLPLAGSGTFGIRLSGSPGGIAVSRLEFATRESFLVASGTAVGLPDSLDFEISADRVHARSGDLRALLPSAAFLRGTSFDSLDASGYARGVAWMAGASVDSLRSDGTMVLGGDAGSVASTFSVDLRDRSRPLVSVDAELDGLDLAAFFGDRTTRLTGRLEVATEGLLPRTVTGDVRVELADSRIGNRHIEHLVAHASAEGTALRFDLAMDTQAAGWLRADGLWTRDSLGTLSADAAWSRFDVAPLLGTDSLHTLATGRLGALFTGHDEASYAGVLRLEIDSTVVRVGGRESLVLPQRHRLDLARADAPVPRIRLSGDALDADIHGDVRLGALSAVASFWSDAIAGAVRRELDKPYPGTAPDPASQLVENARDIRTSALRGGAEQALADLGLGRPLELRIDATVRKPELLTGWIPGVPDFRGRLQVSVDARADADSLGLSMILSGDTVRIDSMGLLNPRARFRATTAFDRPVERSLRLDGGLVADSIASGPVLLPSIDVSLRIADGRARMAVDAGRHDDIGPLHVRADLESLPDRNRLAIREASLDARNYAWSLSRPATIDLFAGGITVEDLFVESDYSDLYGNQSVVVHGAYSGLATDTLFVEADGVRLEELTRFASLKPALGGRLDGQAAFTRSNGRPLLVGDATTTGLVLDGRLIGHVVARSRLVPGSPEVSIRLDLTPADTAGFRWPQPPREVRRNALTVTGTVRLPVADEGDPGEWNLDVRASRADLFFLKYIFNETLEDVGGYLAGEGRVTGSISRPVFDIDFTASEGTFFVPVTGVRYTLEGDVGLTRDAIVFPGVTVRDAGGGSALVTGSLYFNEYEYFSFGLNAAIDELQIINTGYTDELPFYGSIRGSGSATLTGPLAAAYLRVPDGVARDDSELFIPIVESATATDDSFIVFTDSTGLVPDLRELARRPFLLARRATMERRFLDGLDIDINLFAPRGSVVHLVIDPLLGDVINAVSTGRIQIRREQGEFEIFGALEVEGGDYLFTAGEVFVRRFIIEEGGSISWESDPIDARLDIPAVYRTRASWAGLDAANTSSSALIPLVVELRITGRVMSPAVELSLAIDRTNQNVLGDYQALEARLNNPERAAEYATSVLLTNSFQLTTETVDSGTGEQLAFNSVSQLVSAQLNRFLNAALPNVDVSFGLLGERASDLDITYGVALRLLDERLIIRGEGVYQGSRTDATNVAAETMQGEVVVEVRLSPTVSVEVFFRREGDVFQSAELTNTTGAGLSYQTEFPTWRSLFDRLFGWLTPDPEPTETPASGSGELR
jgi:hypothetical protein